jgi:hypothetical protein
MPTSSKTSSKTRGLAGKDKQQAGLTSDAPLPTENIDLPEGLRRQRHGPYDRDSGRQDKPPKHVPSRRK